ncbi:hypothetical protein BJF82_08200 [Kytococcus sp. CUA-901]|nr:hypothetical protein BJF82_08200 [Kytococcus sp. CUA-901]
MTADELRTQLQDNTLGEVADAAGVDRDDVVDALLSDARERATAMLDEEMPQPGDREGRADRGSQDAQESDEAGTESWEDGQSEGDASADGETADDAETSTGTATS